jgi:hypothetical protein
MESILISYYIGIFIVFASHIYMLMNKINMDMKIHSYLNIFAGLCIAYYFMTKEGYLK